MSATTDIRSLLNPGVRLYTSLPPYEPGMPPDRLARDYGVTDCVRLSHNESPYAPSTVVMNALQGALDSLHLYPDGASEALRDRLAAEEGVAPEQVSIGNGSNELIDLLGRAFLSPGREAVISEYGYAMYALVTILSGAQPKVAPARAYAHDLEAMLSEIGEATRLVCIANPNNPTGTWLARRDLERFLERVPRTAIVVVDEAYFHYAEEPGYESAIPLVERFPTLVVLRTFSKAFAMAGLRVGYAVAHPDVALVLDRARQPYNVGVLPAVAALAALDDVQGLDHARDQNRRGMADLRKGLEALGVGAIPSAANFLAVDLGRAARPVYEALLRKGVVVSPLEVYRMPNHLRVTVGRDTENARFLEALGAVLSADREDA